MLEDGMVIETHTPELDAHRRSLLQMLAWRYPAAAVAQSPEKPFHRALRAYGLDGELRVADPEAMRSVAPLHRRRLRGRARQGSRRRRREVEARAVSQQRSDDVLAEDQESGVLAGGDRHDVFARRSAWSRSRAAKPVLSPEIALLAGYCDR
jgi:hypothetical protein